MSERYIVIVEDEGPWSYGPFDSPQEADEWVADEQHSEGVVGPRNFAVTVLNLP